MAYCFKTFKLLIKVNVFLPNPPYYFNVSYLNILSVFWATSVNRCFGSRYRHMFHCFLFVHHLPGRSLNSCQGQGWLTTFVLDVMFWFMLDHTYVTEWLLFITYVEQICIHIYTAEKNKRLRIFRLIVHAYTCSYILNIKILILYKSGLV